MYFQTTTVLSALILSSTVLGATLKGLRVRDQDDDSNSDINMFPSGDQYNDYAICKG